MSTETNSHRWAVRDHKRYLDEVEQEASSKRSDAALALIGARAITERFPKEVSAFDMALTVVQALSDSGVVFAAMSTHCEPDAPACTGDPCTCTNGIGCTRVPYKDW